MPMRTLPLRLIRSQVDSVLDCARAGMMLAVVSAAAATPAAAMSRRRMVIVPLHEAIGSSDWRQAPSLRRLKSRSRPTTTQDASQLLERFHGVVPDAALVDFDAQSRCARHDHSAVLDGKRLGQEVTLEEVLRLIEF